jgi:hypothetical protein
MATPDISPITSPFPEELCAAVALESEADADRVVLFMRELGYKPSLDKPLYIDREVLLFFGAVLRLDTWERAGISIHRDRGMPSARELLMDAAQTMLKGTRPDGTGLGHQVTKIFIYNFSWSARRHLDAPVLLDALDEDKTLDAIAELLWSRRLAERGGAA